MNTSDTSTMSSERLAQYWIEGICMPCISFAGLIGSYNIFNSFYYIIRYLNYIIFTTYLCSVGSNIIFNTCFKSIFSENLSLQWKEICSTVLAAKVKNFILQYHILSLEMIWGCASKHFNPTLFIVGLMQIKELKNDKMLSLYQTNYIP